MAISGAYHSREYDKFVETASGDTAVRCQIDNAVLEVNLDNANDDVLIYGNDGADNQKIKTDADGHMQVDVLTSSGVTGNVGILDSGDNRINPAKEDGNLATISADTASILGNMVKKAVTPVIYNVTCVAGGTEYSQALPANCKRYTIKARTSYAIQMAYVVTESGTNYITVPASSSKTEENLEAASTTLYFQSTQAGVVVEIEAWS